LRLTKGSSRRGCVLRKSCYIEGKLDHYEALKKLQILANREKGGRLKKSQPAHGETDTKGRQVEENVVWDANR